MRDKEEIYSSIIHKIYGAVVNDKAEGWESKARQELVPALEASHAEIHTATKDFFGGADTLGFVRSDNHMKLKAMDLWKEQVEMFVGMLKLKAQTLLEICAANNIEIKEELKELMLIND